MKMKAAQIQRNLIIIDSVTSKYFPDLATILALHFANRAAR